MNEDKIIDSEVVGYFQRRDNAEKWLLSKGYSRQSENKFMLDDRDTIVAVIEHLNRLD
ncbi:terminase small subunit [Lysinibacillus phage vB_LspM-01]|nr:terminase small subunit [Lysinibacillus phage vB_LspM-01]